MKAILGFMVVALMSACSASQVQTTQGVLAAIPADLAAACATAQKAAGVASATVKGGAANTVSSIVQYVDAGCATGEAMAAIAADPSSTQWVANLATQLNAQAASAPAAKS